MVIIYEKTCLKHLRIGEAVILVATPHFPVSLNIGICKIVFLSLLYREAIIAAIPSYEEPYIKVPKVLNKE